MCARVSVCVCFVLVSGDREKYSQMEKKKNGAIKHLVECFFERSCSSLLFGRFQEFLVVGEIEWNHPLKWRFIFFFCCSTVFDKCCQNRVIITSNFGYYCRLYTIHENVKTHGIMSMASCVRVFLTFPKNFLFFYVFVYAGGAGGVRIRKKVPLGWCQI